MSEPNGAIIDVCQVTRRYQIRRERRTLFRVFNEWMAPRPADEPRPALSDVSLTAKRGDKIAVIGNNGAGKTTLLKVVAGILRPTSGTVRVGGEMVLITSLGAGMIDEVSILDNTLMYGALYGVAPVQMRADFGDVLEWAGITAAPHAQLKTLSTGTRARLAFSVVRHIDAEILIIDEALSAGDVAFRAKARAFFDEPQNDERTFLVATHDMAFARTVCTQAVWLHEGLVKASGPSGLVVDGYLKAQAPGPEAALTGA